MEGEEIAHRIHRENRGSKRAATNFGLILARPFDIIITASLVLETSVSSVAQKYPVYFYPIVRKIYFASCFDEP